ncbi:MAG: SLBB domain-containing protein [Campylobacterales bacterium]|nr:SLBB domain-containing protein [Campylobacterales bacterium]
MSRFISLFILLTLSLYAIPSVTELKSAIKQNPELLNTPEAQAEMQKRGITDEDVKQKLLESESLGENTTVATKFLENDIEEFRDNNESNETNTTLTMDINETELSKRLNPFTFNTSEQLRLALQKKKTRLTEKKLSRFSKRFYTNKNSIDSSSIPTPADYIISSGDELNIYVYGDRDTLYNPVVNSNGTIELPYIGPVKIGGMEYAEAKKHLEEMLKNHFTLSDFSININKYSTIQVTLIGDILHPGLYNLSSFSTVKDLLIASKGIGESTSVRDIIIKRDGKIIERVDFYDLLFEGKQFGSKLLKHGDLVFVKQAKTLVSIDGYVNNSAIFELKDKETLNDLLRYAGGIKADASKLNIKITRFTNNSSIESFEVSQKDAKNFTMKNGDSVTIYPLDESNRANVNIYGNVIRPGSYPITKAATLNELLLQAVKEGRKKFFLPETYLDYGVIKRYSKNLRYETISFNINELLENKKTVAILPQDEVYIFSQNDIFSSEYVTTKGKILLKPGKLQYFQGMTLADAIHASGVDSFAEDKVKVTTFNTNDLMPKTSFYSLKTQSDIKLSPYDEIEVLDYYDTHFLKPISINGEVVNPSIVYYEKGMSVETLIEMAGGLTPKAYKSNIEIVRYYIDENEVRQRKILKIDTKEVAYSQLLLEPYDEVMIFKIPQWNENQTVELKGEVKFPGKYTIEAGERLSSVLRRAGGFTNEAFIEGTVFTRESIRLKQIEQYNRSLSKIKRQLAIYNAMPANSKKSAATSGAADKLNEVMEEAKKYQPIGRISVKIDEDLDSLEKSEYNLALQDKDVITVPSHIDTVSIFGEVFNPTSFVYRNNLNSSDYIELASGYTRAADESRAYIIHADGTSEPAYSGWWIFTSNLEVKSGDTIVVPIYIQEYNQLELWDSLARIMSSFAITAATLNTLGVIQ